MTKLIVTTLVIVAIRFIYMFPPLRDRYWSEDLPILLIRKIDTIVSLAPTKIAETSKALSAMLSFQFKAEPRALTRI